MNEKQDMPRFLEIMSGMIYNFGGTLDEGGVKMQFEVLKKYSIEQVQKGCIWLIENRRERFMPTAAEMIEAIEEKHFNPDIKHIAQIQADIAVNALKLYGSSRTETKFDDYITEKIMCENLRYKEVADRILISEFDDFKNKFIASYKAYSGKDNLENKNNNQIENKHLKKLTHNMLCEIN